MTEQELLASRKNVPPLSYKTRRPNSDENKPKTTTQNRILIEWKKEMQKIENDDISHYEY